MISTTALAFSIERNFTSRGYGLWKIWVSEPDNVLGGGSVTLMLTPVQDTCCFSVPDTHCSDDYAWDQDPVDKVVTVRGIPGIRVVIRDTECMQHILDALATELLPLIIPLAPSMFLFEHLWPFDSRTSERAVRRIDPLELPRIAGGHFPGAMSMIAADLLADV